MQQAVLYFKNTINHKHKAAFFWISQIMHHICSPIKLAKGTIKATPRAAMPFFKNSVRCMLLVFKIQGKNKQYRSIRWADMVCTQKMQ